MNQKITRPTKSLLEGGPYTSAAATDLRARFAQIRQRQQAQEAHTKNVRRLDSVKRGNP